MPHSNWSHTPAPLAGCVVRGPCTGRQSSRPSRARSDRSKGRRRHEIEVWVRHAVDAGDYFSHRLPAFANSAGSVFGNGEPSVGAPGFDRRRFRISTCVRQLARGGVAASALPLLSGAQLHPVVVSLGDASPVGVQHVNPERDVCRYLHLHRAVRLDVRVSQRLTHQLRLGDAKIGRLRGRQGRRPAWTPLLRCVRNAPADLVRGGYQRIG